MPEARIAILASGFGLKWAIVCGRRNQRKNLKVMSNALALMERGEFGKAQEMFAQAKGRDLDDLLLECQCLRALLRWPDLGEITLRHANDHYEMTCLHIEFLYLTRQYTRGLRFTNESRFNQTLSEYRALFYFELGMFDLARDEIRSFNLESMAFQFIQCEIFILAGSRKSVSEYYNSLSKRTAFDLLLASENLLRAGCFLEARTIIRNFRATDSPWYLAMQNVLLHAESLQVNINDDKLDFVYELLTYALCKKSIEYKNYELANDLLDFGLRTFPESYGLLNLKRIVWYKMGKAQLSAELLLALVLRRPFVHDLVSVRGSVSQRDQDMFREYDASVASYERFMLDFNMLLL